MRFFTVERAGAKSQTQPSSQPVAQGLETTGQPANLARRRLFTRGQSHSAPADPAIADKGQAVLRGFPLSGAELGGRAPGDCQDRMASGRAVSPCGPYRHQPADGAGLRGAVLQSTRHRRAAPSRACKHTLPGNASRKANTPSAGRGCPASGSATTRCGCNCTRWPTIWRPSCDASKADWSLTSLQLKLIKIGARIVRHARAITFQLAEVAVTGPMVRAILAAIHRLRAPLLCA